MDQAEKLRRIVKQNNQNVSRSARVITVTSGKGGVGKSNVIVNLAVQLKKAGKRVLILDADFGMANIEVMFGAIPKYNLNDVIYKGMSVKDIVTKGPMDIDFISGGSGVADLVNLSREQAKYLVHKLQEIDQLADVILVDTGAGIGNSVIEFLKASEEIVLVTTPEPTSITDSYSLLKALNASGFKGEESKIYFLANRVQTEKEGIGLYQNLNVVSGKFLGMSLEYLGMIPQDDNILRAVMQQMPVCLMNPEAKSSKAFGQLSARIMNEDEPGREQKNGISGLLTKLFRRQAF